MAPGYGVRFRGGPKDSLWPDERSLLQFYFPAGAADDADVFVAKARALAEPLPFVSGYASPSLQYSPDLMRHEAMRKARAVAARYPGYDVHYNQRSAVDQGDFVRGARWLTFLGPAVLKKLGGAKAIDRALSAPVTVTPVGHGLMIRASQEPEIGDENKRLRTPGLRQVGKLLEPVTNFDDTALVGAGFAEDATDPLLLKWQRRFVD
jgi:hypothetical protein